MKNLSALLVIGLFAVSAFGQGGNTPTPPTPITPAQPGDGIHPPPPPPLNRTAPIPPGPAMNRPKPGDPFPMVAGNLKLSSNHMAFMNMKNNATKTDTLKVLNNWTKPITMSFENLPKHLTVHAEPATLAPGDTGRIIGTYDASKKGDWGFVQDRFNMATNDSLQPQKALVVSANIEEFFPPMTAEDSANAPRIKFSETNYNFGKVKQGEVVHKEYQMVNMGHKDLMIRKTKASCGCTASQPTKTTLAPGDSAAIKVDFNTAGKHGKESKTITVISNDPRTPSSILVITGEVEVPEVQKIDQGVPKEPIKLNAPPIQEEKKP